MSGEDLVKRAPGMWSMEGIGPVSDPQGAMMQRMVDQAGAVSTAIRIPPATSLIERFIETAFMSDLNSDNIIKMWSGGDDEFMQAFQDAGIIPNDVDVDTLKDYFGKEAFDSFLKEKLDLYGLLRNGRLTPEQASGLIGGGNINDPIPSIGIPQMDKILTPLIMHARQFRNKLNKMRLTHNVLMNNQALTLGSFAERRALRYTNFIDNTKMILMAGVGGGLASTELGKSITRALEKSQMLAATTLRTVVGEEIMRIFNLPAESMSAVIEFTREIPGDIYDKLWQVYTEEAVYRGHSGDIGSTVIIEDITAQFQRAVIEPVMLQIEESARVPEDNAPNWYEPPTAGRNGLEQGDIVPPATSTYGGNSLPQPLTGPGEDVANADAPPKRGRGRPPKKPGDPPQLPPRKDLGERGPGRPKKEKEEKGKQSIVEPIRGAKRKDKPGKDSVIFQDTNPQDPPIDGSFPAGDSTPGFSTAPDAPNAGDEPGPPTQSSEARRTLRILKKLRKKVLNYVEDHVKAGEEEKPDGLDERLQNTLFTYFEFGRSDPGMEEKIKKLALAQNYYRNKAAFDRNTMRRKARGAQRQPFSYPKINQSQYY